MRSLLLLIPILFSACCVDPVIPPKIVMLKPVPDITVTGGAITGDEIKKVQMLRKSERYYIEQVTKYNEEFANDQD